VTVYSGGVKSMFIIPYHAENIQEEQDEKMLIADTIEGLLAQTDGDWNATLVVDGYSRSMVRNYLHHLKEKYYPKIDIIFLDGIVGPGVARNLAVIRAIERGCSILLFNDADDVSHPKRLEVVKNIFLESPEVDVVYSTFEVIDENNHKTPRNRISSPILEILESHEENPIEGSNIWIKMGTDTGYTNMTSSTAVRTKFAYQCPFPNERASEDFHSWMRMSAFGANFKYTSLIPTKYRVLSFMKYQASRTRIGPSSFNKIKTRVDCDGFSKAIEIALVRNIIRPEEIPMLKARFYKRLAKSMEREKESKLAGELLNRAKQMEHESYIYAKQQY
jgi:glycosyltransferase involved in cell wall biosynthesis